LAIDALAQLFDRVGRLTGRMQRPAREPQRETRDALHAHGDQRGIVPVSVRAEGEQGALGNRITAMLGPLPVYANDAVERLRIVTDAMKGLKESKQAVGAEALTRLQDFAPPTILAQASRLNFSQRAYNLLVTNVPGPQFPLYLIGREMQELAPVPFLAPERALAVAIMSYNGQVTIGLMGDYDAMGDLDTFGEDVEISVAELLVRSKERTVAVTPAGSSSSQRPVTRSTE
jgi:hypothetical protein